MDTPKCQSCSSEELMYIEGESNQHLFNIFIKRSRYRNCNLPGTCNVGFDNVISFTVCLICGQMQGTWPIKDEIKIKNQLDQCSYYPAPSTQ